MNFRMDQVVHPYRNTFIKHQNFGNAFSEGAVIDIFLEMMHFFYANTPFMTRLSKKVAEFQGIAKAGVTLWKIRSKQRSWTHERSKDPSNE